MSQQIPIAPGFYSNGVYHPYHGSWLSPVIEIFAMDHDKIEEWDGLQLAKIVSELLPQSIEREQT